MSQQAGLDDEGLPITEADIDAESYRAPLGGAVLSLLPPDDFRGNDEDWEDLQLVEAVRRRRRLWRQQSLGHPGVEKAGA